MTRHIASSPDCVTAPGFSPIDFSIILHRLIFRKGGESGIAAPKVVYYNEQAKQTRATLAAAMFNILIVEDARTKDNPLWFRP
jgi:hypothetical protein